MGGQVAAARLVGVNPRTMRRWVAGESTPRGLARKALEKHMGKIVVDG
jgi:DNA-binding transcriptional regulator YiaG